MIEKALLAVDGSESSNTAARTVNDLVRQGVIKKLIILTVGTDYSWGKNLVAFKTIDIEAMNKLEEESGKELVKKARELITGDIEIIEKTSLGNPADVICEEAKNHKCDMIVMGRTGKGTGSKLLIGSVSNRVLHFAPCTVVVVKE